MGENRLNYINNEQEESHTRFISFKGDYERFDLAIITSNSFGNDCLVLDMNSNKFTRLNAETLNKPSYVEHAFQFSEIEAEDFRSFIKPFLNEN